MPDSKPIKSYDMTLDDLDSDPDSFYNFITLNFDFTQKTTTIMYYSSSNALSDLGGLAYFIYCLIYFFSSILLIVYLSDVVKLIQQKYI